MADQTPAENYLKEYLAKAKASWNTIRTKWQHFEAERPRWALAGKIGAGLGLLGFLFIFSMAILVHQGAFGKLPTYPDLRHISNYTASEVYSEDEVLLGKYYIENRINADFEEISPNIINALVATEDARFFKHSGVDMRAWFRVLFKTVLMFDESSGGGSTLSQQLSKNLFPRKQYWAFTILITKMKEMFIARRLEKIYTKEELLRLYLNTVPFSENIFGIKVAAQRFFNVSPQDLTVEQAAVLVGMLKATTRYNPVKYPERATTRRNTVINQMAKYGYIDEAARDSLKAIPLELSYYQEGHNQGLATYFREHLRLDLEELLEDYTKPDGSPYNLYTDGLKIYTSINTRMQQHAEDAVAEHMAKLQQLFYKDWKKGLPWGNTRVVKTAMRQSPRYKRLKEKGLSEEDVEQVFNTPRKMTLFSWDGGEVEKEISPLDSIKYYLTLLNTGLLAVEPQSGLVKAWVGGIDHKYVQYDHVKSRRQVGSTFKPVVFAAALQNGMLPCEYTYNRLVTYTQFDNWQPKNANGEYGGVYSMEGALSKSINSVAVEIMLRTGVDTVKQLARDMGITSTIPEVPAIALGTVDASLLDMVTVYSTFANRGLRPNLHYLDRIETSDGNVILEFDRPEAKDFKRALTKDQSDMMIKMMRSVVDSGTARKLRYEFGLYNQIAGKTGTTQNHTDGWFLGFTPKLVAGVWVGAENPSVHFRSMRSGQGSSTALPIWGRFMKKVQQDASLKAYKGGKFTPPADTIQALMECPPFLDDMPILVEDWWFEDFDNSQLINRVLGNLRFADEHPIQLKPKKPRETEREYMERMRRYNERIRRKDERREKRKEMWNKILFGKENN